MTARIAAIAVRSAFGRGVAPLVDGIARGERPRRRADGLGFPGDPAPWASRYPHDDPPGERSAAVPLIDVVDDLCLALGHAGASLPDSDCALVVGTGGMLYASSAELYQRDRAPQPNPEPFRVRPPSWAATLIVEHLRLRGPVLTLSTGCASSANALLAARDLLERGQAQRALVVGAEGLSAVTLSGFDSLMLLDPAGCRPFDRDRAGLQLGEAVAALMLERVSDDAAEGLMLVATDASAAGHANGNVRLLGGANRVDTHHLTSASPGGEVMAQTMRAALADACIEPAQVSAIKAHGTGSADSDAAEAAAIMTVFGATHPPITALKGYLGHTLGACGALETATLAACVEAGFVPAAGGFATVDPELRLEPLRGHLPMRTGVFLLNYFGFGGNDTALVVAVSDTTR